MSYFILFVILIFLVAKYEKTICFLIAFCPLLNMIGVTNSINIFQMISVIAVILFLIKNKYHRIKQDPRYIPFPFILTLIFVCITHVLANMMTVPHWPSSIAFIMSEYMMVFVVWNIFQEKVEYQKAFFTAFTVFISIIVFYCMVEFMLQDNPIYRWYTNTSMFMGYDADRSEDIRFGSMRCHSLLTDVGALGTVCDIAFCLFVFHLNIIQKQKTVIRYAFILLMFLCVASSFLTGTRTVILALGLGLLVCSFSLKYKTKIRILGIVVILCMIFADFLFEILLAFTDTESVRGSSSDMRQLQWNVVLTALSSSPIWGLGWEGTASIMKRFVSAYGLESAWFQILVNFGILGAISFALSFLQGFALAFKYKNIVAIAVITIFLIVKTMSSIPGIGEGYFLYIISYLIISQTSSNTRKYEVRNNNNA